jgi:aspartate aminotransferase-like enzyme
MILEEGLENVFARHKKYALAAQQGVAALGLSLFPKQKDSSYVITAVLPPDGVEIGKVIKDMNASFDVMVVGGQKHLKGKLLRIGHCGYFNRFDLVKTFSALELSLQKAGYDFEPGVSVAAVQKAVAD